MQFLSHILKFEFYITYMYSNLACFTDFYDVILLLEEKSTHIHI